MKLYELAPSPNARRVSIFLAEKGVRIERVAVDIRGGENLNPEFQAKSANGRIPMLELDDGRCLCESVAICRYIDEIHPDDHSLFGNTPWERAYIEMWHRIVELEGLELAFQAFRNLSQVYRDRENCVEDWGREAKARVTAFLPKLDRRLAESDYLAGPDFTVVDIAAYVLVTFSRRFDVTPAPEQARLNAWFEKVNQRPSVVEVDSALP